MAGYCRQTENTASPPPFLILILRNEQRKTSSLPLPRSHTCSLWVQEHLCLCDTLRSFTRIHIQRAHGPRKRQEANLPAPKQCGSGPRALIEQTVGLPGLNNKRIGEAGEFAWVYGLIHLPVMFPEQLGREGSLLFTQPDDWWKWLPYFNLN